MNEKRRTSGISCLAIVIRRNVTSRQGIIPNQNRNRATVSNNVKQWPEMCKRLLLFHRVKLIIVCESLIFRSSSSYLFLLTNWGYALRTAAYATLTKQSFRQSHWELQKIYNVTFKKPRNIFNPFLMCEFISKRKLWLILSFSKFRKQNLMIIRENKCARLDVWHLFPFWNTGIVATSTDSHNES